MTDKIDLDDVETGSEESTGSDGDWFWDEGDPPADAADSATDATSDAADSDADAASGAADPDADATSDATDSAADAASDTADSTDAPDSTNAAVGNADGSTAEGPDDPMAEADAEAEAEDEAGADQSSGPIPHVPRENKDRPAGIPVEGGGSGAGAAQAEGGRAQAPADKGEMRASGPHGNDADDMTTAFTLAALRRIDQVGKAVSDTGQWSDWVGIVGDVESHEIQRFQREHGLDVDFFNGTGSGPAERLASIDPTSMFYAERMVVVGVEGEEWVATAEEWEFVPLAEAADGAGWTVSDAEEGGEPAE